MQCAAFWGTVSLVLLSVIHQASPLTAGEFSFSWVLIDGLYYWISQNLTDYSTAMCACRLQSGEVRLAVFGSQQFINISEYLGRYHGDETFWVDATRLSATPPPSFDRKPLDMTWVKLNDRMFGFIEGNLVVQRRAIKECQYQAGGGELARIGQHMSVVAEFLTVSFTQATDLWVDASRTDLVSDYLWGDGSPVMKESWLEGQPDLDDAFATFSSAGLLAGHQNNTGALSFICQRSTDAVQTLEWVHLGPSNLLLSFVKIEADLDSARSACSSQAGNVWLAYFDEPTFVVVKRYILEQYPSVTFWVDIDVIYGDSSRTVIWGNGAEVPESAWSPYVTPTWADVTAHMSEYGLNPMETKTKAIYYICQGNPADALDITGLPQKCSATSPDLSMCPELETTSVASTESVTTTSIEPTTDTQVPTTTSTTATQLSTQLSTQAVNTAEVSSTESTTSLDDSTMYEPPTTVAGSVTDDSTVATKLANDLETTTNTPSTETMPSTTQTETTASMETKTTTTVNVETTSSQTTSTSVLPTSDSTPSRTTAPASEAVQSTLASTQPSTTSTTTKYYDHGRNDRYHLEPTTTTSTQSTTATTATAQTTKSSETESSENILLVPTTVSTQATAETTVSAQTTKSSETESSEDIFLVSTIVSTQATAETTVSAQTTKSSETERNDKIPLVPTTANTQVTAETNVAVQTAKSSETQRNAEIPLVPTTTMSTQAPAETTAVSNDRTNTPAETCLRCCRSASPRNVSADDLEAEITRIRSDLVVDKKILSATIRRKISAPDHRPSAQATGVSGLIFMAFVIGAILIPDLLKLFYNCWSACKTMKVNSQDVTSRPRISSVSQMTQTFPSGK